MNSIDKEKCYEITKFFLKHPAMIPFKEPVDDETYKKVIKKPMDFKTVLDNLRKDAYTSHNQWKDDVELIWRNAKEFNKVGHYVNLAEYGQKLFKKEYSKKFYRIEKLLDECAKLESELDKLLSNPPTYGKFQGLAILQQLSPKEKKSTDGLVNEVYENIVKFTDEDSQREIFSILRMFNPKFGGSAIVKNGDNNIKETIQLAKLPPKVLESLKKFIDTHKDRIKH